MRYRRLAVLVLALSLFAALGGGVASASEHADGCIVSYDGHKEWYDSDKEWYDSDKEWYDSDKEWHRGYIAEDLCYAGEELDEPDLSPTAWWFFSRMR